MLVWIISTALLAVALHQFIVEPLFLNPRSSIPGPLLFALTKWRLAIEDWRGTRTRTINRLHQKYGPVVRIGPNEVHFNSLTALRTIYGAGSGFERTSFYRMFDAYGKQNLFTFGSTKQHGDRKKLVANAYSKSLMLKGPAAGMIQDKVAHYLDLVDAQGSEPHEIFSTLHYFSLDSIAHFLYGPQHGGTAALTGEGADRSLLNDILDPARRRLSWFAVHMPVFTKWLYTRTHSLERLLKPLLPMQKPSTYTGIRVHALEAFYRFRGAADSHDATATAQPTIIAQLWKSHQSQKVGGLGDLDIASECADHLLAGIDTTADSLMFLIWAISRPEFAEVQCRLTDEINALPAGVFDEAGAPNIEAVSSLVYVDAVIKETVRLYNPLPASEPRSIGTDCVIDGFVIPANTVVCMSPYSLHRNAKVFIDPSEFRPERWLGSKEEVAEMNRWFWGFSSGGRMCIGVHLAMAEMTALVVAIYRKYRTRISDGFEDKSPAITSRFELFYDETMPTIEEHKCMITFTKQ